MRVFQKEIYSKKFIILIQYRKVVKSLLGNWYKIYMRNLNQNEKSFECGDRILGKNYK